MVQGLQYGIGGMYYRTMTVALFSVLYNYVPLYLCGKQVKNETKNKGTLALYKIHHFHIGHSVYYIAELLFFVQ